MPDSVPFDPAAYAVVLGPSAVGLRPDLEDGAARFAEAFLVPWKAVEEGGLIEAQRSAIASVSWRLVRYSNVQTLNDALRKAENDAAAELARDGRSFLGVARVLAQNPNARPAPGEPRRALNPRVACRNKWKRIEVLLRLAEFASAYREARDAWRAGVRDALFPHGTWLMRVQHVVRCASCA